MPPLEADPVDQMDVHLLQGCCREAQRADIVASNLEGLRAVLQEPLRPHLTALIEEMRATARVLRELADRAQVHIGRVHVMLNYLNVVLPCLQRTLRDVTAHCDDKTVSREVRWRRMYRAMMDEVGGLALPLRFGVYNSFLMLLKHMLTRSVNFDLNALETLRGRILQLREARGISPPTVKAGPLVRPENMAMFIPMQQDPSLHWAEQIFSMPLSSRTAIQPQLSNSWGPHKPWGHQLNVPKESKILFRWCVLPLSLPGFINNYPVWVKTNTASPFDDDRLSLMVYLNLVNQVPYLLIRTFHVGSFWFSQQGAHELRIVREGSALLLRRWSATEQRPKPWASLCFKTWEETVLFHSSFVSLKARNALTVRLNPDEHKLANERRLFRGRILDDGFNHTLSVYRDTDTRGLRLHASVSEGDLRHCPVWTAFITHQAASPSWLHPKSRHRVWLRDVQLYVFCQEYRQQSQRRRRAGGAFELHFLSGEEAAKFRDVFSTRKRSKSRAEEPKKEMERIEEAVQVGEVETPMETEMGYESADGRVARPRVPRSVTVEEVEEVDEE